MKLKLCIILAAGLLTMLPYLQATIPPKPGLSGSWQAMTMQNGAQITRMLLLSNDYFAWTEYKTLTGEFLLTKGGTWQFADDKLVFNFEFNTADSTMVGQSESWRATLQEGKLQLHQNIAGKQISWERIDKISSTELTGAWLMGGRVRNGEVSRRATDVPRKTMKILTGSRFQWIAYNTETKQFFGTGGGVYAAKDGKYIEQLVFFSRDSSRVGMNLEFNYELRDGDWHHIGKSIAGEPLHEIWVRRIN